MNESRHCKEHLKFDHSERELYIVNGQQAQSTNLTVRHPVCIVTCVSCPRLRFVISSPQGWVGGTRQGVGTSSRAPLAAAHKASHTKPWFCRSTSRAQCPAHKVAIRSGTALQTSEKYAVSVHGRATATAPIMLTAPAAEYLKDQTLPSVGSAWCVEQSVFAALEFLHVVRSFGAHSPPRRPRILFPAT